MNHEYHEINATDFRDATSTGVGVTKAPFVNISLSKIFDFANVPGRFFK